MLLTIDPHASLPLYKQIHDQIIAGIAMGQLEPGQSLPSVRALASDLGINLHTVNKAYAVLRDEGYVLMRGRAGAVITEPASVDRRAADDKAQAEMEDELFRIALAYRARGGERGRFLELVADQAARVYGALPGDAPKANRASAPITRKGEAGAPAIEGAS